MRKLLLCLTLAALTGCGTVHMPTSDSLSEAQSFAVHGRQGWKVKERLTFGPFMTATIERSWTSGRGLRVSPIDLDRQRQTYSFVLREDDTDRWRATCETRLRRGAVDAKVVDIEFDNASQLVCTFLPTMDGAAVWQMNLGEEGEKPLDGRLTNGTSTFAVRGTDRTENGFPADTATGYFFEVDERAVAAVEVINNGIVMLPDSDDARTVLAAASTALLLLEDLRGYLTEN